MLHVSTNVAAVAVVVAVAVAGAVVVAVAVALAVAVFEWAGRTRRSLFTVCGFGGH